MSAFFILHGYGCSIRDNDGLPYKYKDSWWKDNFFISSQQFIGWADFPSEFSVLPKKISKYLLHRHSFRRKYARNKNFTQKLNISNLHSRRIFPPYKKHHFMTWYCPFQGPKYTISHHETGVNRCWNRIYQNTNCTIPYSTAGYIKIYTAWTSLFTAILKIFSHLFCDFILSKKSRKSVNEVTPKSWTC